MTIPQYCQTPLACLLKARMMAVAGCQPPWSRFPVEQQLMVPRCSNWSQLTEYRSAVSLAATRRILALIYPFSIEYNRLAGMGRDELVDTTHCMMPCTFLEYQVFIICLQPE